MRTPIRHHAAKLTRAAKHPISQAGAIRDLLAQVLRGAGPTNAYLNGYTQGFLAGYGEGKARVSVAAKDGECGRIGPQPTRDNGDYRRCSEDNGGEEP